MTKQLNVVDHKIKLFKAPLPPPRYALALALAKLYPKGQLYPKGLLRDGG